MLKLTPIDYQARRQKVAASVRASGFDAYVGTRQAGLHYLSGAFMPWRGAVIITANGDCNFIYWAWDASRVKEEGVSVDMTTFTASDFIRTVVGKLDEIGLSSGRIGVDMHHPGAAQIAPGMLCASELLELKALLPHLNIQNGVTLIDEVMLIKDVPEIERLRLAAHVADMGLSAGMRAVRPGVTENSVAGVIEKTIRDNGSTWAWALTGGTEVGSGIRTGYFHGVTQQASEKLIQENEFVILDLHPMVELYLADLAIPVFLGKPSRQQQGMIDCWEEVVATMIESMKPDKPIREAVKAGLATFEHHGLLEYCLPAFGHGLGTCARTRPFINMSSEDIIQTGMVVALGTHLYIPEVGGMRLELPLLVTQSGGRPLVHTPPKVHVL